MGGERRFSDDWELVVLADRVLAEGTWTYQGKVQHSVRLLQRTWDYTSTEIEAIETAVSDSINGDYIDYAISDNGNVFSLGVQGWRRLYDKFSFLVDGSSQKVFLFLRRAK